jgi:hypothetical protein
LGLGSINPLTFSRWSIPSSGLNGLVSNVLEANALQLILSLLHFTYNGLFTAMYMAWKWSEFAREERPRVSTRMRGEQTSNHFLSLSLRIVIPLMCFSDVLHWLLSQYIFLAAIESYSQFNPQT